MCHVLNSIRVIGYQVFGFHGRFQRRRFNLGGVYTKCTQQVTRHTAWETAYFKLTVHGRETATTLQTQQCYLASALVLNFVLFWCTPCRTRYHFKQEDNVLNIYDNSFVFMRVTAEAGLADEPFSPTCVRFSMPRSNDYLGWQKFCHFTQNLQTIIVVMFWSGSLLLLFRFVCSYLWTCSHFFNITCISHVQLQ